MINIMRTLAIILLLSESSTVYAFVQMAKASNPVQPKKIHISSYSYPTYGYPYVFSEPIDVLPAGAQTLFVGTDIYFYDQGVFYQKNILEQKYFVVPPPIGAVVYNIPQGYQLIVLNGVSFYESGGIYFKRTLEGYKVVRPPVNISSQTVTVSTPRPVPSNVY